MDSLLAGTEQVRDGCLWWIRDHKTNRKRFVLRGKWGIYKG